MTFKPTRLTEFETNTAPDEEHGEPDPALLSDEEVAEPPYKFPWNNKSLSSADDSRLDHLLELVVHEINTNGYTEKYRQAYCWLSQRMNTLGLLAPAFRPRPTIPWNSTEQTSDHLLIQRDRIVIDCHWLYSTKSRVYSKEAVWSSIVNPRLTLQTERIEKFASTKLRNEYRADSLLELTEFQQAQMAALKGSNMREAFSALNALVASGSGKTTARFKKIDKAIREWSCKQPRFEPHYEKYRAYALAIEVLDKPTIRQVSQLAGFILGKKPLSDSSARNAVKFLRRLIEKI